MRKFFQPILLFFILSLAACGDEQGDLNPPTLSLETIEPSLEEIDVCGTLDENSLVISTSDTLRVHLNIIDDEGLSELKLDIHQNFDCHGHGGQAPGFTPPSSQSLTTDWEQLQIIELDGTEEELFFDLVPPENGTAGNYHLTFRALDLSGNESDFDQIYNIVLKNSLDTIAPILEVNTYPDPTTILKRGDAYVFNGVLSDNKSLSAGGNAIVFLTYKEIDSDIWITGPYETFKADELNIPFTLNFSPPRTITRGSYDFAIWAFDGVRNRGVSWQENYTIEE